MAYLVGQLLETGSMLYWHPVRQMLWLYTRRQGWRLLHFLVEFPLCLKRFILFFAKANLIYYNKVFLPMT